MSFTEKQQQQGIFALHTEFYDPLPEKVRILKISLLHTYKLLLPLASVEIGTKYITPKNLLMNP